MDNSPFIDFFPLIKPSVSRGLPLQRLITGGLNVFPSVVLGILVASSRLFDAKP
jgi:hypothetical protein